MKIDKIQTHLMKFSEMDFRPHFLDLIAKKRFFREILIEMFSFLISAHEIHLKVFV